MSMDNLSLEEAQQTTRTIYWQAYLEHVKDDPDKLRELIAYLEVELARLQSAQREAELALGMTRGIMRV